MAEHLQGIYQQTGEVPDGLNGPEIPMMASHVWQWFSDLHHSRSGPITYMEIDSYSRLSGIEIRQWELSAIKKLDILYFKSLDNG